MNKTTTPTTFADLVSTFGQAATRRLCDGDKTPAVQADYENALTALSTATTFSVLRKAGDPLNSKYPKKDGDKTPTPPKKKKTPTLVTVPATTKATQDNGGQSPAIMALRRELTRDLKDLDRLSCALEDAYAIRFNKDGISKTEIADPESAKVVDALTALSLGDGLDLVNDAVVAILDETAKQIERNDGDGVDLARPYSVRRLNRKVWIKLDDSVNGWTTETTTPIQEVFKAVRRSIMANRSVKFDPKNGYTYLEDLAIDGETETETAVYRRLPKYADMGGDGGHNADRYIPGQPATLDGKPTNYSGDRDLVDKTDRLVGKLSLTTKQATVLTLRQSGHGNKAIATYLGVTENSVKGAVNEIRRKAKAAGLDPAMTPADPADRKAKSDPCKPDLSVDIETADLVQGPPRPVSPADPATPSCDLSAVYPLSLDCPALAKWLAAPVYYHTTIEDDHKALAKWLAAPVYYHVSIEDDHKAATLVRQSYKARFAAKYGLKELERCRKIYG